MKITVWLYFIALSIVCLTASVVVQWFGLILHRMSGHSAFLPWPTETLISCYTVFYLVPLPSLILAISVSGKTIVLDPAK